MDFWLPYAAAFVSLCGLGYAAIGVVMVSAILRRTRGMGDE